MGKILFLFLLSSNLFASPASLKSTLQSHSRILIFAPHPDDDVLGSSAVMRFIVGQKNKGVPVDLKVVFMTCGDGYEISLNWLKARGRLLHISIWVQ